ncbi:hypothetical protein GW17_00047694 [Ensete ventricosum]|nr:hypothetical protein GW17_00047694 [Ensete ventricosum]
MAVDFDVGDATMAGAIGRSEGQREKCYDHGVRKVSRLVEADTTVVVHEKDGLVQKDTSDTDLESMTMNLKEGANDSAGAKFDNPIRSNYHTPVRSSSYWVGKVSLLVGADAIVVLNEKDGLVQKDASIEE